MISTELGHLIEVSGRSRFQRDIINKDIKKYKFLEVVL